MGSVGYGLTEAKVPMRFCGEICFGVLEAGDPPPLQCYEGSIPFTRSHPLPDKVAGQFMKVRRSRQDGKLDGFHDFPQLFAIRAGPH